ncbi:PQQ-binding-like beta-propeller repeat protein [Kitasatospora aburaviensis]
MRWQGITLLQGRATRPAAVRRTTGAYRSDGAGRRPGGRGEPDDTARRGADPGSGRPGRTGRARHAAAAPGPAAGTGQRLRLRAHRRRRLPRPGPAAAGGRARRPVRPGPDQRSGLRLPGPAAGRRRLRLPAAAGRVQLPRRPGAAAAQAAQPGDALGRHHRRRAGDRHHRRPGRPVHRERHAGQPDRQRRHQHLRRHQHRPQRLGELGRFERRLGRRRWRQGRCLQPRLERPKPTAAASGSQLLGIWGADKTVVRADSYGIRGLNAADGKELWSIAPPSGSKEFCAASYGVNSKHIAAVALNTGDSDCSTVGAIDVSTGKLLWTVKASQERMSYPTLTVTDKVIGIGASGVVGAVNVADGSPAWQFQPREKDCSVYGKAAGNQIAVSDRCYGLNTTTKSQLVVVDADTGKTASGAPITLTGSIERVDKVISDQPLVLLVTNGPNGDYILPFDKSTKPMTPMSVKEPGADSLRLSGQSDAFTQNVVSGNTLYVQVNPSKPAVNAYDLTTGKRLWSSNGGNDDDIRLVSGTDKDGKVRAVVDMGYNKDAKLVTLSPTDGKPTDLGTITSQKSTDFISITSTEYVLQSDGSLYGFSRSSGSDSPVLKYAKK